MISEKDKSRIVGLAKKYNVSQILLFGSNVDFGHEGRDIDLAVEGVRPKDFFKFYGELIKNLSKPVDLIDLSQKSLFNDLVAENGMKIYARARQKSNRRRNQKSGSNSEKSQNHNGTVS
ncbi:MAG: nucleotidyltransferase domain-containing protein [Phycisphaerae bacterium]